MTSDSREDLLVRGNYDESCFLTIIDMVFIKEMLIGFHKFMSISKIKSTEVLVD